MERKNINWEICMKANLNFSFWFCVVIFLLGHQLVYGSSYSEVKGEEVTYPRLKNVEGSSDPSLAVGLAGINDWHSGLPFLDIMKMSRVWIGHKPGKWGGCVIQISEMGDTLMNMVGRLLFPLN
ncbi:MAG: hypothetical protein RNU03_16035 [Candidatus Sedimenticola sp. (ex Thyasira tokunagai)]